MIKRIFLGVVLFVYIILLFFSACTSLVKKQPHISHVRLMDKILTPYDNDYLPYQNFIYIKKYIHVNEKESTFCSGTNVSVNCDYELYGEGSGIAVNYKENKLKILTVYHVCKEHTMEALSLFYMKENGEYDYPNINLKVRFYGHEYEATVVKEDPDNDLCVIEINSEYSYKIKKIKVANEKPKIGETVYTLSAPQGIAADMIRLKFHGSWAGCDQDLTKEDYCYYTIPASPGSSGSGIFNQYGELISVLSIAMTGFDEISGGPRQYYIKKIIKN